MSFVLIEQLLVGSKVTSNGGWSPERPSHDYELGTFSSISHPPGRGEGLTELKVHLSYVMKLPWKSPTYRVPRASVLLNTRRSQGGVLGEGMEAWSAFLSSSHYASPPFGCSSVSYPFMIKW